MILQGTTPTITITVDDTEVALSDIAGVELCFSYPGNTLIKTEDDVTIDTTENTIAYTFTEAETLAFPAGGQVFWQLRLVAESGSILGTTKQGIRILDLISEEVLTSE